LGEPVDFRVSGMPFNESMLLAIGAGRMGIPLIMVGGDDQLEDEIRRYLPWVRYATVKSALGHRAPGGYTTTDQMEQGSSGLFPGAALGEPL
jgi:D-aminopeptidase